MLHPITKWAQRKDKVFLEVALRDISNENIELTDTTLTFVGDSDKQKYEFAFEFYGEVDKVNSKWTKTGFHLIFVIEKKDPSAAFWPRLLKTTNKNQYIQVDWSKWVDQDEGEGEDANKGLGGFDPSQMQNFGGMGGMPGMGGMGGMPGMGGMGGMPGMGGFGGMPGMGGMGGMDFGGLGQNFEDEEEEAAQKPQEEEQGHGEKHEKHEHVHGANCSH